MFRTVREWQAQPSICMFGSDIKQAFDCCPVLSVASALGAANVAPNFVAAMIKEQRDLTIETCFQGLTVPRVEFCGVTRQGGVGSTFDWNITMSCLFDMLHTGWEAAGLGLRVGSLWVTHIF